MVMISFESPALWSLHIIRLLWGWTRGEQRGEGGGGGGVCVCVLMPVKAAEQKEKAMNSSPVCVLTDQEVSHFFDSVNK